MLAIISAAHLSHLPKLHTETHPQAPPASGKYTCTHVAAVRCSRLLEGLVFTRDTAPGSIGAPLSYPKVALKVTAGIRNRSAQHKTHLSHAVEEQTIKKYDLIAPRLRVYKKRNQIES